jgi:hypothetical protein
MNRALKACTGTLGLGWALALGACTSPQVGAPCPIPDKATAEQRAAAVAACFGGIGQDLHDFRQTKDVDILFLIDNSPSMAPKQAALAKNIPEFIKAIDGFGADYHVGIATSDVGSTTAAGMLWSDSTIAQCNTFAGDDGALQAKPCSQRTNGTSDARNACATLCTDPNFRSANSVTTDGNPYISKVNGKTNVPNDNVTQAFQCAALVGDGGCGIEGQLEGAKRALDGHLTGQLSFKRPYSYLSVIFITDEDDCSVQPTRRTENNPATRACTTADQNADFSCYNFDYRCLARSVQCDEAMNVEGTKHNCRERADNYLSSVKSYHDFFSSVVEDPKKLLIAGIWTQPGIDNGGQLVVSGDINGNSSQFLNRAPGTMASCRYTGVTPGLVGVFGQAQRRLTDFAKSFGADAKGNPKAPEFSICDADNYAKSLKGIEDALGMLLDQPACLPVVPKSQATNAPVCLVGDVSKSDPGSFPDKLFPVCSQTCCSAWANSLNPTLKDAAIGTACAAETKDCFCAVKSSQPTVCADKTITPPDTGAVGGVWRVGGAQPPVGTTVSFRCAGGG